MANLNPTVEHEFSCRVYTKDNRTVTLKNCWVKFQGQDDEKCKRKVEMAAIVALREWARLATGNDVESWSGVIMEPAEGGPSSTSLPSLGTTPLKHLSEFMGEHGMCIRCLYVLAKCP